MPARSFLFTILMMLFTQLAYAQLCFPVKKVHAFFQPVTAGTMSKEEAANRKQKGNYLVYITSKKEDVQLNNIWINGELHHAELEAVTTPVTLHGSSKSTIIPHMNGNTYQLKFTALDKEVVQPQLPAKYASAPLVLELRYKKRVKFISVASIKQLDIAPLY